jgi:hypothetical protein
MKHDVLSLSTWSSDAPIAHKRSVLIALLAHFKFISAPCEARNSTTSRDALLHATSSGVIPGNWLGQHQV